MVLKIVNSNSSVLLKLMVKNVNTSLLKWLRYTITCNSSMEFKYLKKNMSFRGWKVSTCSPVIVNFVYLSNFGINAEFNEWKLKEEFDTNSFFVSAQSNRDDNKTLQSKYLYCNRSGYYKSQAQTPRDRQLKPCGSCKMDSTCPSYIILKRNENECFEVTFYKTHHGHKLLPQYLRLPVDEVEHIKGKLANDVSTDRILNDARGDSDATSPLKKKGFSCLKRKI